MGLLAQVANLFGGPRIERPAWHQREVDDACTRLALYHFDNCPYCVRVRRQIHRLRLPIALQDVRTDTLARQELTAGGGHGQVPCLRIDEADGSRRWLYESADIISYLEGRFGG